MRKWTFLDRALLAAAITACLITCHGCGVPRPLSPPAGPVAPVPDGPAGILLRIADLAAWVGGGGFIVSIVVFILLRQLGLRWGSPIPWALAFLGLAVSAQCLHWFGEHLALIALVAGIAGAGIAAFILYRNRRVLEPAMRMDLDADGHIGPPPEVVNHAAS